MTSLVTGATGFVGSAVMRELVAAGHRVRVLVRAGSDRRNLEGIPCEVAIGDLLNHASLAAAVAGCDAVFHVAADYRLWVPDPDRLNRINVEGTVALFRAAAVAGVSRMIYTSSVATLGHVADGGAATEDTSSSLGHMIGEYKRSKFRAEQAVRVLIAEQGLPIVIVNPSAPVGPRDIKPTPTGRLILDAATGRMPAYVRTGLNIVHVDDVARGHVLAHDRGRVGERYILGGENLTLREILAMVASRTGARAPRVCLPHGLVLPVAYVAEAAARLSGREPAFTVDSVRMARTPMYFDSTKAQRELGYASRPSERAIADAVTWFEAQGYLGESMAESAP